jgi:thiamine biosynthesis lipoprotein
MHLSDLASHSFGCMGTDINVLAPAPMLGEAVEVVEQLFDEWDRRFSRFRADSELTALNDAAGTKVAVSQSMLDVVAASLVAARVTDGLFDPTLLPRLVDLGYHASFEELGRGAPASRPRAWRSGSWREIRLDRDAGWVWLPHDVALDFGGIAKGMAVDAAVGALAVRGLAPAAVNAGGDLGVNGAPDDGWPIALDDAGRTVTLRRGALATSSVLKRRWRTADGERHHLIDPRTGEPAGGPVVSASVAAGSCRAAEVAAKTLLLLGPGDGAIFLAAHRLSGVVGVDNGTSWNIGDWREAA